MTTEEKYISWKTLRKAAVGQANEQEREDLERWLNDSEANRTYYRKACAYYAIRDTENDADYREAWHEFEQQIQTRRYRWLGWAAAVVLLAASTFAISYLQSDMRDYKPLSESAPITPVAQKVTLTLSNGETLKIRQDRDSLIRDNDEQLLLTSGVVSCFGRDEASQEQATHDIFHTITVPSGTMYKVVLSDSSVVWLNARSAMHYPVTFKKQNREVTIEGEAYFEVRHDAEHPFIVHAAGNSIRVLGTKFNVNASEPASEVQTTLVSGSVEVQNKSGERLILRPSQQACCMTEGDIELKIADVLTVIDWQAGLFVYKQEYLDVIMKDLERWYDIDVSYESEKLKQLKFTGVLDRNSPANTMLDYFQRTRTVSFDILERKVYVKNPK
ncbi:MAG: FecR family protein [Mangrovibacterium sp.]